MTNEPQLPEEAPLGATPPTRICRKCAAQATTSDLKCPHCGASYVRGFRRFSRRGKIAIIAIPIVLLLAGAGVGVALKIDQDNQVEADRKAEQAEQERIAEEERQPEEEAAAAEEEAAAAKKAEKKIEVDYRKTLVRELEAAVKKDARGMVDDGLVDGPIIKVQCDTTDSSIDDLDVDKADYSCLAANKIEGDYLKGPAFSANVDYEGASYTWHLGQDSEQMSDEPAIRPRITVHGDEGALFEYYPFAGPDYSPGETGWVLVLTGTPQVIDPQAVTVSDVLGDLLSMLPDEPSGPVILRVATEEMITVLERGQAAPPRHPGEPEVAERLAALRQELREAFPD